MVDTTQPASAAEFIAAGASPADAAMLADQANTMAGRNGVNARVEMEVAGRNAPPPPKPAAPAPTTNAQLVEAQTAHQDAQLADSFAQLWQPPSQPYEYQFPTPENASDEHLAADTAVKTALHSEGFPKFLIDSLATSVTASMRTLVNETAEQEAARHAFTQASLASMWKGEDFNANIALVDGLLKQAADNNPALRDAIAGAAPRLSPIDVDLLLQFARQRSAKR